MSFTRVATIDAENNCRVSGSTPVQPGGPDALVYDDTWGAQLRMNTCVPARVDACDFESFGVTDVVPGRTAKTAVILENCTGALVSNCNFYNPTRMIGSTDTMDSSCRGIVIPNWNGRLEPKDPNDPNDDYEWVPLPSDAWATVLPCVFSNVGTPVEVGDTAVGVSVHPQRTLKGENTAGEISFKLTGIALPTIVSSSDLRTWSVLADAAGHLLFDASPNVNKLKCWDGSSWRTVAWEPEP